MVYCLLCSDQGRTQQMMEGVSTSLPFSFPSVSLPSLTIFFSLPSPSSVQFRNFFSGLVTTITLRTMVPNVQSVSQITTFFLPHSLSLEVGPLKPARGSGSIVSSPAGSGAKPRPKTNLVHSRAVRKPLVAIILSILKCMFYSRSIKI